MAAPFGESKSPGGTGERPAPTIEGTATEISSGPADDAAASPEETARDVADQDDTALAGEEASDGTDETEAPQGEAEPPPPPGSAGSGGRSVVSHLAAGLIGGLAGAAVLAFAWSNLPLGQSVDLASLEERLAKLEAVPPSSVGKETLDKLAARLDALEAREGETPPEVAALAERVSQLEESLKAMAEAAQEGGSVADAAVISQQINEAEQRLKEELAAALADAKTATTASLEAMQKQIAELDAKLKALAEAELGSGDAGQLGPEIAVIEERLAKIEATIPGLIDAINRGAEDTKAATLAIAFANLRAAVSEGRPYAAELAILAALSPGTGDLGALLDYDDEGIPTLAELTRSFKIAKDAALAAASLDAGGSFFERLLASMKSLIKIRRVDAEAVGDEPGAVLARAEAVLDRGDLAAAVREVETLQGAPRAAFTAWLDQAKARLGAEETLAQLQTLLLASLGGDGIPDADESNESE